MVWLCRHTTWLLLWERYTRTIIFLFWQSLHFCLLRILTISSLAPAVLRLDTERSSVQYANFTRKSDPCWDTSEMWYWHGLWISLATKKKYYSVSEDMWWWPSFCSVLVDSLFPTSRSNEVRWVQGTSRARGRSDLPPGLTCGQGVSKAQCRKQS